MVGTVSPGTSQQLFKSKDDGKKTQLDIKTGGNTTDEDMHVLKDILDSSAMTSIVSKQLKPGDEVSISLGDKQVVTVKRTGRTALQRLRDAGAVVMEDASQVIKQDPAIAFKSTTLMAQEYVKTGFPASMTPIVDQGIPVMYRAVSLILDGKRWLETRKSTRANTPDRVIGAAHLGTDLIGLAGVVMAVIPGVTGTLATVAGFMGAAGLLGDIGAHGYNIMRFFENRGVPIPDSSTTPTTPTDPYTPTDPSRPRGAEEKK